MDDASLDQNWCELAPAEADPAETAPAHVSCTFEKGICEWTEDQDEADFVIVSSTPANDSSAPSWGIGKYLLARQRGFAEARTAVAAPNAAGDGYCLGFFYSAFGTSVAGLTVFVDTMKTADVTDSSETAYVFSGNTADRWERVELPVMMTAANADRNWRIRFRATVTDDFGDVALDEVVLSAKRCSERTLCNFEYDFLCGWTANETTATAMRWQHSMAANVSGIPSDHTTNTESGHLINVDLSKGGGGGGDRASIWKEFSDNVGKQCLTFYYFDATGETSELNVLLSASGDEETSVLWSHKRNYDTKGWRYAKVDVSEEKKFKARLLYKSFSRCLWKVACSPEFVSSGFMSWQIRLKFSKRSPISITQNNL